MGEEGDAADVGAVWTVPEPLAVVEVHADDGTPIILRRHGNPDGPRLVVSHGNGFSVDAYYPFWSLLLDRFDVILWDQRSHGWNPVGELDAQTVPAMVADHGCVGRAVDRHFGVKSKVGVLHSMSALTAVLYAAGGDEFSAMVLFDPVICPLGCDPVDVVDVQAKLRNMSVSVRRRPQRFESVEVLAESIGRASVFGLLLPGVAELLAETMLRPAADGDGYELRCSSEHEARIIDQSVDWVLRVDLGSLSCPVKAIGSDPTVPFSFLPSVDLGHILVLDYDFVPDTSHFLLLEKPEECLDAMLPFLERHV